MNRRDFLKASACVAAGGALGRAWAADAQACVPPVKVTPYFKDGWTMYMFANRGNAQMLSTLFRSPSGPTPHRRCPPQ